MSRKPKIYSKVIIITVALVHILLWISPFKIQLEEVGLLKSDNISIFDTKEKYKVKVTNRTFGRPYLTTTVESNSNFFLREIIQVELGGYYYAKRIDWNRINENQVEILLVDKDDVEYIDTIVAEKK